MSTTKISYLWLLSGESGEVLNYDFLFLMLHKPYDNLRNSLNFAAAQNSSWQIWSSLFYKIYVKKIAKNN